MTGTTTPPTPAQPWLRGSWVQTFTGKQFFPLDPRPQELDIADIAHSLAMQTRYNGHTAEPYTVAQHCVLLSHAVSHDNALWALLHDATEAYIGDLVRPLKRHLPDYIAIEDRLMAVIAERYGLIGTELPDEVAEADTRILLDERAALLRPPPADWGYDGLLPLGLKISVWPHHKAEAAYLRRFTELTGQTCAGVHRLSLTEFDVCAECNRRFPCPGYLGTP